MVRQKYIDTDKGFVEPLRVFIMKCYMRFFVGHKDEPQYIACGVVGFRAWTKKTAVWKLSGMIGDGTIKSSLPEAYRTNSHYIEARTGVFDSPGKVPKAEIGELGLIEL